jgi:very-short-patch-repair endonuclease
MGAQLDQAGLPPYIKEHRFSEPRKWRFDIAWIEHKLALEIEGGVHNRGRHTRPVGYEKDCEKYNNAILLGWRVLRVTSRQVMEGEALAWVQQAIGMTDTTKSTTKTS